MNDFSFEDFLPETIKKDIEKQKEEDNEKKNKPKRKVSSDVMLDTSFFLSNALMSLLIEKNILRSEDIDAIIEELMENVERKEER